MAAATESNFRRAAALLNMTQPPLSRQIHLLEDNLGVKLFERIGRTVKLTAEGHVFLGDATRLLALSEQAETAVRRASKGKTGRVRIGFTGAAGYELIPQLLVAAKEVLPDIDVVLLEMISVAQIDAFSAKAIDLGFIRPLSSPHDLEFLLVDEEPLIIALPADHPLCKHDEIQLKQLNDQPFIMHAPTHGKYFYDRIMGMLSTEDVKPRITQYIDQTPTILSLVRAGLGLSILPASAQRFHYDKIAFRLITDNTTQAEMSMAWRSDQANPAVTAFRVMAAEYFATKKGERLTAQAQPGWR